MDQMGYASALGDGPKRRMPLNLVRLRCADVPAFVAASQLISGYTLQTTGQLGLNAYPNVSAGNYVNVFGNAQYTTCPTISLTIVTGDCFARSYLRPLAPAELLSPAQSGLPIDLLFRVGVHSVNGHPNQSSGGGGIYGPASGFKEAVGGLGAGRRDPGRGPGT